ncbi:MAG: hypothetical protein ACD_11C00024G0010 [uncultured bacterium]|nr:MAG: hypothetical protein ACD_11C00024G0010 [uncultured bacterium]HBR72037.1 hypothetical protein [Candidatus Moranbacteria bacterium]
MNRHFVDIIKQFIREKGLQDLSSDGWSRMRQAEKDINSGKINSSDAAIEEFLKERDFQIKVDRHGKEDLKKKLDRN